MSLLYSLIISAYLGIAFLLLSMIKRKGKNGVY
jgi:hypothetical protein